MARPLELPPATRTRILAALSRTYNAISLDAGWDTRAPSSKEFAEVILDRLYMHGHLSEADTILLDSLTKKQRRQLCDQVGP